MGSIVVYTAIFGQYDGLLPQPKFTNIDYICFTDQPFKSKTWKIEQIPPKYKDHTRNSRMIKINPHLYLPKYDISVFIDGNFLVKKDINKLINDHLNDKLMLIFDHNQTEVDARDCIYKEYEALIELCQKFGIRRDDPAIMTSQVDDYKRQNYPENNGLISSGILIRKHHHPEVIKLMNVWWAELTKYSIRDQLSFNYAAWKCNFPLTYLSGDIRNNEYFRMIGIHRKNYKGKYFRYRIKKMFGLI